MEVIEDPDQSVNGREHYLFHHPVIRKDKNTTKLRIVYDALARLSGPSLNDCFHARSKFEQRILDILLQFHVHRVALAADIEKAFPTVSMAISDRDTLQFLWIDDINKDSGHVFHRVGVWSYIKSVTSQCYCLKGNSSSQPRLVETLRRSIYVDDIATGANTEDEAYHLYSDSMTI